MIDVRKKKSSRFNLKMFRKESVMLRNNKPTPEVVLLSKRSLFWHSLVLSKVLRRWTS